MLDAAVQICTPLRHGQANRSHSHAVERDMEVPGAGQWGCAYVHLHRRKLGDRAGQLGENAYMLVTVAPGKLRGDVVLPRNAVAEPQCSDNGWGFHTASQEQQPWLQLGRDALDLIAHALVGDAAMHFSSVYLLHNAGHAVPSEPADGGEVNQSLCDAVVTAFTAATHLKCASRPSANKNISRVCAFAYGCTARAIQHACSTAGELGIENLCVRSMWAALAAVRLQYLHECNVQSDKQPEPAAPDNAPSVQDALDQARTVDQLLHGDPRGPAAIAPLLAGNRTSDGAVNCLRAHPAPLTRAHSIDMFLPDRNIHVFAGMRCGVCSVLCVCDVALLS